MRWIGYHQNLISTGTKQREVEQYKVRESISINGGGHLEEGSFISKERFESISKFSPELVKFFEKVSASKAKSNGTKITKRKEKSN